MHDLELVGIAAVVLLVSACVFMLPLYLTVYNASPGEAFHVFPPNQRIDDPLANMSQLTLKAKCADVDLLASRLVIDLELVPGGNFTTADAPGRKLHLPSDWEGVDVLFGDSVRHLVNGQPVGGRGNIELDLAISTGLSLFPFDSYSLVVPISVVVNRPNGGQPLGDRIPLPVRVQLEAGITLYQVQVLFEAAHSELPGWPLPPPPPPLLPLPPNVSRPPPSTPAVHGGTGGSMAGAGRGGKFYEKLTSNSGWGVANRRLLRLDALGGGVRGSGSQPQHVAVGLAQTAAVADVRIRTPQQEPPPDFALVLELSLVVRRINSIRVFSIAIVTIMWLLSSFLLALTLDIMFIKKRRVSAPFFAGSVTMLFALPGLRNAQPGVPPVTVVGDVVGYYINLLVVSTCVLMLMVRMAGQHRTEHLLRE